MQVTVIYTEKAPRVKAAALKQFSLLALKSEQAIKEKVVADARREARASGFGIERASCFAARLPVEHRKNRCYC